MQQATGQPVVGTPPSPGPPTGNTHFSSMNLESRSRQLKDGVLLVPKTTQGILPPEQAQPPITGHQQQARQAGHPRPRIVQTGSEISFSDFISSPVLASSSQPQQQAAGHPAVDPPPSSGPTFPGPPMRNIRTSALEIVRKRRQFEERALLLPEVVLLPEHSGHLGGE